MHRFLELVHNEGDFLTMGCMQSIHACINNMVVIIVSYLPQKANEGPRDQGKVPVEYIMLWSCW